MPDPLTTGPLTTAMVLAAGFGVRMRPLTNTRPKPLVPLCGAPLIDWTMDRLRTGGVTRFVVNAHYFADQIEAHFAGSQDVILSQEPTILETGGGVARALPLLGDAPFFVANADMVWLDGTRSAISRMRSAYDPAHMDILLLLHPTAAAGGDYSGSGDYHMDRSGVLRRRAAGQVASFLFAGISILSPTLFDAVPEGAFSLNVLFDRAQSDGRLYGLVHDGAWYHIGTPAALAEAERVIKAGYRATDTR